MKLDRLPWINTSPYDQVLNHLISSCQKRDVGLICVQGPNGSGKSRILTELLSTLSNDTTIALIALSGSDNEIFYNNAELSPESLDLTDNQFLHNFTLKLEESLQDQRHICFLIDDIEDLSYDLMHSMMAAMMDNPTFKERITFIAFMGTSPSHIEMRQLFSNAEMIPLKGMTVTQLKQFVDQVHQYMRYDKELSMFEVNQLHSLSYGYVGRLMKLLESSVTHAKKPVSIKFWLSLISVIVLLLIVFFVWKKDDAPLSDTVKTLDSDVGALNDPILITKEIVPVKLVIPIQASTDVKINDSISSLPETIFMGPDIPKKTIDSMSLNNITTKESSIKKPKNFDKKTVYNYVIELERNHSKAQLETVLKGRSIPGKAQFKQIDENGSKIWIAYIGPYGSEEQARQGKAKLPASLQNLPLKVRKEF